MLGRYLKNHKSWNDIEGCIGCYGRLCIRISCSCFEKIKNKKVLGGFQNSDFLKTFLARRRRYLFMLM